ncbi:MULTISPECIES: ABC transporter permease [Pelosinus]|jgi:NitT/TauT family transport system permease protein|uniref:ABC-type transporter, integral membrane subunit n=1 Tax=Pelosinus fermentans B4 TaxID=1149862 RepID=I8R9K7_9FIRM|nr:MULTISPECIES: ABC transporter permease subunit [Pelosinus]EIW15463.1 ABC-type transporter, integral membrane subunit [Pelosinus fermentans B4]EIW26846.1 ABC-type transporter, integral membrane subunit [Pelosinus fermentans A11]OAM92205.1 ABC-type transporter, integral membrane subunit [Pelosinus fermentans DSM 17108]SDQ36807.1 NitT/TauT family transport system permease protein [Pelosinus fermentans]
MAFFSTTIPKHRLKWVDAIVLIFVFAILYSVLNLGASMNVPFSLEEQSRIELDPSMLPYYAGRSLLRMFIAFGASLIFTLIYGYIAAKSQTAETVLIPLLDMLQSIPVLGFLSATIVAFIALFPGNLLGVELASIFAIFTGQAWNMTFSFYNSLKMIPKDLQEASNVLRMNWWQRFLKLELPFSMISLVWNSMMSFGGGWFFLAASEAISVLGQDIRLPGVGSYLATAIEAGEMQAIAYSIVTMILMITLVDQLFWRPLVVWSQKFKMELTESVDVPTSFVYNILYRSTLISLLMRILVTPLCNAIDRLLDRMALVTEKAARDLQRVSTSLIITKLIKVFLAVIILRFMYEPVYEAFMLVSSMDNSNLAEIIRLGLYTLGRVMIAVLLGALWTVPVGVWIGLNPRLAKVLQPIIQIAASFPANMMFPFITILFLKYQVNFEWGSIFLMMLGTQWYILFNVIAGTMSIPNDLHEAGAIFKLQGWQKWKTLILPSIFPYLITGIITASGGAWNASIVSEMVSWHDEQLVATGIGSFISNVTDQGDWGGIIWGITVMCVFVVLINRFLWRRLYQMAETKYHLE